MKLHFSPGPAFKIPLLLCLTTLALLLPFIGTGASAQSSSESKTTETALTQTLVTESLANYTIPKITAVPRIDGELSAGEWEQATQTS